MTGTAKAPRRLLRVIALASLAAWRFSSPADAQMPDLRAMMGKPLPAPELAPGTVTVRVAKQMPSNPVPGVEVTALVVKQDGEARKRAAKTGGDGRATFEALAAGATFEATVTVDGETLHSSKFPIPAQGGTRVMLIAGLGGPAPGGGAPGGGASDDRFALGAVTGSVEPRDGLAKGTLEIELRDAAGAAIAGREVKLGRVDAQNGVHVLKATSDEHGVVRFGDLPTGDGDGYAAVIEHEGMRLGTEAFRMSPDKGLHGQIKALRRTTDPSGVRIDSRSKIIFQLGEDSLQVMEALVFTNGLDAVFDPGPGGVVVPLPKGFVSAQEIEGGASVEVRAREGVAVHATIPPNGAAVFATQARFGFVLPANGAAAIDFRQPLPYGMESPLFLVPATHNLTLEGPGLKALPDQTGAQGDVIKMYELSAIPPGGTLSLTVRGLPARDRRGRTVASTLSLLMVAAAIAGVRRPRAAGRNDAGHTDALVQRREKLFAELVEIESARRAANGKADGALEQRRREVVGKLEGVYRELAGVEQGESPPL